MYIYIHTALSPESPYFVIVEGQFAPLHSMRRQCGGAKAYHHHRA